MDFLLAILPFVASMEKSPECVFKIEEFNRPYSKGAAHMDQIPDCGCVVSAVADETLGFGMCLGIS